MLKKNISRYYFSGGTTSKPKVIPFTEDEWEKRAKYRADCYKAIGLNKNNKIAILLPFGPWIAGPSVQEALFKIGCTVFPIGLIIEKEKYYLLFDLIRKYNIDTIISMPSTIELFIKYYKSYKVSNTINLKNIITSGEFLSDKLRNDIRLFFKAKSYSSYAASEFFIGVECKYNKNNFHYNPSILNIKTNNSEELLFTSYISETYKVKNYSLGDIGRIIHGKCECGILLPKVYVKGRKKGNFVLAGGINVTTNHIINALKNVDLHYSYCKVIISNYNNGVDKVIFEIGVTKNTILNENKKVLLNSCIENMSMDFRDVVDSGQVTYAVKILLTDNYNDKIKITVKDLRNYER